MLSRLPSLRTRLAVLFGAFAIALAAALSLAFEESAAWRLHAAQEAQLAQAANQMADRLDRDMYERLRDVILLASTDGLAAVLQMQSDGRERLERVQKSYPNYAWIGVMDEAGKVLVATGGILEGADVARRPWFAAAQNGPATLDAHPAVLLEPYLPKTSAEPLRLVDVAAPIIGADGRVHGMVSAHLSMSWAKEVQQTIFRSIEDLKDAEVLVVSRDGEVLVGPTEMVGHRIPGDEIQARGSSGTVSENGRSADYVGAVANTQGYRNFAGFGWRVIARQPAVSGLGIGGLFVLGGTVIARSVAQPLEELAEAANLLRSAPSTSMPMIKSRYQEIAILTASLSSAFSELQSRKDALKGLNGTLELRVAERTRELEVAKNGAEAATRAKTDFLATMSHELRSPLSSIIGFSDLLLETTNLDETSRRRISLIQSAGSALTCVINDILDFSKIEAGRVEILSRPFRLECLIDGCISIMQAQADAKGVALITESVDALPRWVLGDEGRLRQVLLNLINNAVKFTKAGHVTLRVSRDCASFDRIAFTVIDTGIGIPEDRIGRLFQRFSQADSEVEREFGGTGLGLAISQSLAELMGGQITVRSQVGGGSTFAFTVFLPETEAQAASTQLAMLPTSARSLHILLAEDLVPNQEIATAILTRAGHTVEVVGDGEEAVEAAASARYDLILMDVQMPRMDGLAATRAIRAFPTSAATTPIIAMTANVLPEQVQRFRKGGMDAHVGKPINPRELLSQIETLTLRSVEHVNTLTSPADETSTLSCAFEPARYTEILELLGPEKVRSYLADLTIRTEALPTIACSVEVSDLGAIAHKLVALAGMLGFTDLSESCAHLDATCEEPSGDIQGSLRRVCNAAARVLGVVPDLERSLDQARNDAA
jgi:signal transduction histidine kinase/DNA-binding NarL/FixJ family response regulator